MTIDLQTAHVHDTSSWACLLREHFVALDVQDSETDGFSGDVETWKMGHLQLSTVRSVAQAIDRSKALVRHDHRAYLQVGLVRRGHAVARQDGREAVLGPGDFIVYETTRPFQWWLEPEPGAPDWQLDVFTWPRTSIGLSESDTHLVTATTMDGRAGLSGIISRMLRDLVVERPAVEGAQAVALADEIGDLLAVLTAGTVPFSARRPDAELLARIDAHISDSLGDPDLGPESVALAHSISVRQLHRLFADRDLTVSRTIRARRLDACRRELVATSGAARSVTEIARRWGFPDAGIFGRAFRETYGVSPGAYRTRAGITPYGD